MLRRIATVALLLAISTAAHATEYYVDALNGSDANTTNAPYPGPAGTGPWQTPYKISTLSTNINPGDVVAFKGGPNEVYRPSNSQYGYVLKPQSGSGTFAGNAANPVWVTSYGESPAPTIDGADCAGAQVGPCASGVIQGGNNWAVYAGSIYREAWTQKPYTVYIDGEAGYPTLRSAACPTGVCASVPKGGTLTIPTRLPFFATGFAYNSGNAVQNAGNWYTAGSTATSGGTAPTCTTGTCSDGTITWTFMGRSSAVITTMTPGSWYWGGSFLYIWMPNGDSPATHAIEVSDVVATVFVSANGSENNGIIFDHLTIRHGCINYQTFSGQSGGGMASVSIQESTLIQAGTGPTDTGEACNNTYINGGGSTFPASSMSVVSSRLGFASHGVLTAQCVTGSVFQGNDIGPGPGTHGAINIPQSGTCVPTGDLIEGNIVHDAVQSPSNVAGQLNGQPNGIYVEYPTPTTIIAKNTIFNMNDYGGCLSYGQPYGCSGIQTYGGTGGSIIGNYMEGVNSGFTAYNGSSAPINLIVRDNVVKAKPGVGNYAVAINTTCVGCVFDHNDWWQGAQTVVAITNGVSQTFAQWQTAGNDPNGSSVDPIGFLPSSTYWLEKKMQALALQEEASGGSAGSKTAGGGGASLLSSTNTWTAVNTFSAGIVNSCKGTVTLSGGAGTASNGCITATGFPICVDTTTSNAVSCTPANGSLGISGTGTDIVAWLMAG